MTGDPMTGDPMTGDPVTDDTVAGDAVAGLLGPVTVGPPAHGGHCVGRLDGRVLFIRHALPGEVVRVRVTDATHDRFWRADAVEIIQASPERVEPQCPIARPGGCGGCDLQHASADAQRAWKQSVVAEQLDRLAGITWDGTVEPAEPQWGWRTRMRYLATGDGTGIGLRAHRSHAVIALPEQGCAIASAPPRLSESLSADTPVTVVDARSGALTLVGGADAPISEQAAGRAYAVSAQGFWQVHPAAADTLVDVVLDGLAPRGGERAFDLYCGVGLFAGALVDRGVRVWGVESGREAIAQARRNVPEARFTVGRVERALTSLPARTDLVVLDPPRTGAGKAVMRAVAARRPRAIAYVACDPAALARDLGTAAELGYAAVSIRAFDLFPQTHHVECVAVLRPVAA